MRSEKQLWKLRRQNTWSPSSFKIRHKYQVQDLSVVCGKNEIWKPITKAESKKSSLSFEISYKYQFQDLLAKKNIILRNISLMQNISKGPTMEMNFPCKVDDEFAQLAKFHFQVNNSIPVYCYPVCCWSSSSYKRELYTLHFWTKYSRCVDKRNPQR